MADNVEVELWKIFTHYTLLGNPFDPRFMKGQQFLQFSKDCGLVRPSQSVDPKKTLVLRPKIFEKAYLQPSEKELKIKDLWSVGELAISPSSSCCASRGDGCTSRGASASRKLILLSSPPKSVPPLKRSKGRRLPQTELSLLFMAEISRRKKLKEEIAIKNLQNQRGHNLRNQRNQNLPSRSENHLDYLGYLNCLLEVASKLYPSPPAGNRCSSTDEAFQLLLMDHVLPLATRKEPTCISTELQNEKIIALRRRFRHPLKELFQFYGSEKEEIQESDIEESVSLFCPSFHQDNKKGPRTNTKKEYIRYDNYIRFCQDFGLSSYESISMYDVGHIYLSCISMRGFSHRVREIEFDEFWEILVRFAIKVNEIYKDVTVENKMKSLMLYICNFSQNTQQRLLSGTSSNLASSEQIIRGVQLLNERALTMWKADSCCNYLEPPQPEVSCDDAIGLTQSLDSLAFTKVSSITNTVNWNGNHGLAALKRLLYSEEARLHAVDIKIADEIEYDHSSDGEDLLEGDSLKVDVKGDRNVDRNYKYPERLDYLAGTLTEASTQSYHTNKR